MTLQEHKTILAFLDHALGDPQEPLDVEADAIIRAYFKRNPDAAYRVTKLAMSLTEAPLPEEEPSLPKRRWWLPMLRTRDA